MQLMLPTFPNPFQRPAAKRRPSAPPAVRMAGHFDVLVEMANAKFAAEAKAPARQAEPVTIRPAAAAVRPVAPHYLRVGIAAPFGVSSLEPFPGVGRVRLLPGCFDAWFRGVAAGFDVIDLHADHSGPALASTGRGLEVWASAKAVYVGFTTPSAIGAVDRFPHFPALSIGFTPTLSRPSHDDRGPVVDVVQAVLGEVSLVPAGKFPGTYSDHVANAVAVMNSHAADRMTR